MIPPFDKRGNLPPGIHKASWSEIEARFGTTPWRRFLLVGLRDGLDLRRLDPTLLDFSEARKAQKRRFGGEFLPADMAADSSGVLFMDYFQRDRETGEPKGIVAIDLAAST